MKKNYIRYFFVIATFGMVKITAQELKIFTKADFDLIGNVKKCVEITKYGKEEYYFNTTGVLEQNITRYKNDDYDLVSYTYKDSVTVEKRMEIYRDGVFDRQSSFAHFFEITNLPTKKIVEQIVNYNVEFVDKYTYTFNNKGLLEEIYRENNAGEDITRITYEYKERKLFKTVFKRNGVLLKEIVKDYDLENDNYMTATTYYENGVAITLVYKFFNQEQLLTSKEKRKILDGDKTLLGAVESEHYTYNDKNIVTEIVSIANKRKKVKNLIYQFNQEKGNWIRKIISPDNTFVTRKITYYE